MRDILFRAKWLYNNDWREGYFIEWSDGSCSIETGRPDKPTYCVDPATVGQYTGLTDKNGKRIFEGDIVDVDGYAYACRWDGGNVEFGLYNKYESIGIAYIGTFNIEIIGNIHDNPELLEGGVTDG